MDLLQRELARKKAVLSKAADDATGTRFRTNKNKRKKYFRQSELRALEDAEEEEKGEGYHPRRKYAKKGTEVSEVKSAPISGEALVPNTANVKGKFAEPPGQEEGTQQHTSIAVQDPSMIQTSVSDAVRVLDVKSVMDKLRALGLPIQFFGETLQQRQDRLDEALSAQNQTLQLLSEKEEFRLGQGHGIRNPFLEKDDSKRQGTNVLSLPFPAAPQETGEAETQHPQSAEDENEEDDPPKRIYRFLKGLLKDWEQELEGRPEKVARSVAGRNESKTLKQCKDYIRPLFKLLKQRKLEPGMEAHLTKIVECAKAGEFVKAHDAYMDVAIGRAAWPIGVTMVGIHARTGRAKIESSNVAHVMNSEIQRKYLTSVKRLLSYAQKKRPDVDPSKKVS